MENNEHCIYCKAGMPIFDDDCEIRMVVYPSTVQPFNTFLRYDNSKTGEYKTVKFNINYCPMCGRKIKKRKK